MVISFNEMNVREENEEFNLCFVGSSRLEIQPITKKEMESEIASLRSKDNRRRDYYEGDSRSRVRSRSRTIDSLFFSSIDVYRQSFRFTFTITQRS